MSSVLLERPDQEAVVFRVLCVEDDEETREATRGSLADRGVMAVDFAETPAEATQHIKGLRYDAVLVDSVLDDNPVTRGSVQQGDEWLLDNLYETDGALRVVVTGRAARIRQPKRLKQENIRVVEKGNEIELYDELEKLAQAKKTAGKVEGTMLANATLNLLYDWIDGLPDASVSDICIGDQILSPSDLKREVISATPLGRRIGRLFIAHLRDLIGLRSAGE